MARYDAASAVSRLGRWNDSPLWIYKNPATITLKFGVLGTTCQQTTKKVSCIPVLLYNQHLSSIAYGFAGAMENMDKRIRLIDHVYYSPLDNPVGYPQLHRLSKFMFIFFFKEGGGYFTVFFEFKPHVCCTYINILLRDFISH